MATVDHGKAEAEMAKPTPTHAEYGAYTPNMELIEAAVATSEEEGRIPKKDLFKMYWPAAMFSMLLSLALVMEGMDVGLINNFFAHQAYRDKFGWYDEASGENQIPSNWQTGIGNANNCGSIIGLLINGWAQARFGSRRVYLVGPASKQPT